MMELIGKFPLLIVIKVNHINILFANFDRMSFQKMKKISAFYFGFPSQLDKKIIYNFFINIGPPNESILWPLSMFYISITYTLQITLFHVVDLCGQLYTSPASS